MSLDISLHNDQRLHALIEHSSDAIALLTPEGIVTYASPSSERVTGYTAAELLGKNGLGLLHPADLVDMRQRLNDLLEQPAHCITVETRLRHADGGWRWMEATLTNRFADPALGAMVCNYHDITRIKEGRERFRQSEERFRLLVEQAAVGIFVTDLQGHFVEVNEIGCQLSGYSRDELLTRHIRDLVPEEGQAGLPPALERLRAGAVKQSRWRMKRKDGSLLPVGTTANKLSTGHLLVIVRDISERIQSQQAREELLAYEQAARAEAEAVRARLYEFLSQAPMMIMALHGPEHRLEFVNLPILQIKDYAVRYGQIFREGWPELEEQGILAILDEVYTTGIPFTGSEVLLKVNRRGDGALVEAYFNLVYQPLRNAQGEIDGLLLYSMEVTEQVLARRRAEELNCQLEAEKEALLLAQREAEARAAELSATFEAMADGVAVLDASEEIRYTNATYRTMLALEEDADPSALELDNRLAWMDMRDMEGRPLPREQLVGQRVLRGERLSGVHAMDILCRTRQGADIILNVSGAPIRDSEGQVMGGVLVLRDMTGRRRLEQQLQYSERKLRSLVEANILGVAVADLDGRVYEINDRLAQLFGFRTNELLSASFNWRHQVPPDSQEMLEQFTETIFSAGAMAPTEGLFLRKDGSRVPILMAGTLLDRERRLMLGVVLDMTEQKAAARRKQEFLSMVSHELRTPLTSIMGLIELALIQIERRPTSLEPEVEGLIKQVEKVLKRAGGQVEVETRLVEDLLDESRLEMHKFELSLQRANLVRIVQETIANQQQSAGARPIALLLPSDEVVTVLVDASRIGQVLTNYLTNAFKYTPIERGVTVQLKVEASSARASVHDEGPGLTPEQQQHVWERFYQAAPGSKETGEGLGLGLAIAKAIIEQHQGQVGVESDSGRGSTFWFSVPLADALLPG
jgi:PAS domain S-box-containing protein